MTLATGFGTPATAAGTATLTTLRARVLTQITAARQLTDYMPVTASSADLAALRDRIEVILQDSGNATWATGDLDEALTHALEQYSRHRPNHTTGTLTLAADGREISLATLTTLIRVEKVWWPYDSTDPDHPPNWVHFDTWPTSTIYINEPTEPASGDKVRVFYTAEHTIEDLESATATTIPVDDESFILNGAAAFAARFRAVKQSELANVDDKVYERLMSWAKAAMSEFTEGLRRRYSRGKIIDYDQDDLDEAIRWALHRYNEVFPDATITTITLAAAGREVDVSSITDYHQVLRVWWPYSSTAPSHPPRWRDFELWPGAILYIDDSDEPQSGDVVRIWYTRLHTLYDLDAATATTIPTDHDNLIVTGAAGFAAQERIQDEDSRYVPRKLREFASKRLAEFERGLKKLAKEDATRYSGIAAGPTLDRWEDDGSGWA